MKASRAAVAKAAEVDLPVAAVVSVEEESVKLVVADFDADGLDVAFVRDWVDLLLLVTVGVVEELAIVTGHLSPAIRNNKFAS